MVVSRALSARYVQLLLLAAEIKFDGWNITPARYGEAAEDRAQKEGTKALVVVVTVVQAAAVANAARNAMPLAPKSEK